MKKILKGAQRKKNPGARGKFKRERRKMEKEQGKYKKKKQGAKNLVDEILSWSKERDK